MVRVELLPLDAAVPLLGAGTRVMCYRLVVLGTLDTSSEGSYVLENSEVIPFRFMVDPY